MSRYDSDWDKYDLFNAMRDFLKKTNYAQGYVDGSTGADWRGDQK